MIRDTDVRTVRGSKGERGELRKLVRIIRLTVPWYGWWILTAGYIASWILATGPMAEAHRILLIVLVMLPIALVGLMFSVGGFVVTSVSIAARIGLYEPPAYFTYINVLTLPLRLPTMIESGLEIAFEIWGNS